MSSFEPRHLNRVMESIYTRFKLPREAALSDNAAASQILSDVREGVMTFGELTFSDMDQAYHLASLCSDDEYVDFRRAFTERAASRHFRAGWIYCQINAGDRNATALFEAVYEKLKAKRPSPPVLEGTLAARTGMPWNLIYERAVEIMRIDKLSLDALCDKYDILPNTPFYSNLMLVYLSKCGRDELKGNEGLLGELIAASELEFLRPAVRNYTSQVAYEEMSGDIINIILARLSAERGENPLGISPKTLQIMRQRRYKEVLDELTSGNREKADFYSKISGNIRKVEFLDKGFFAVDFGSYAVIDNPDWKDRAYAFKKEYFTEIFRKWEETGRPENFWPPAGEGGIQYARDAVLGLSDADIVRIGFTGFDSLYARDLLSKKTF